MTPNPVTSIGTQKKYEYTKNILRKAMSYQWDTSTNSKRGNGN